jgi:hypothetical protein
LKRKLRAGASFTRCGEFPFWIRIKRKPPEFGGDRAMGYLTCAAEATRREQFVAALFSSIVYFFFRRNHDLPGPRLVNGVAATRECIRSRRSAASNASLAASSLLSRDLYIVG